jgi:hypothetical protein
VTEGKGEKASYGTSVESRQALALGCPRVGSVGWWISYECRAARNCQYMDVECKREREKEREREEPRPTPR